MKYIDLSLKELENISVQAAEMIAQEKKIDLVIYIARSGFLIGKYMSRVLQCKLLGIGANRKGDKLKALLGGFFTYVPRFVRDFIFRMEFQMKIHSQYSDRHIKFHASLQDIDCSAVRSILIVDDSIDTGNSMKQVLSKVSDTFSAAEVTTYALNVFEKSKDLVRIDYVTFQDTFIRSPMSKDSKEYKTFCNMYQDETQDGYV